MANTYQRDFKLEEQERQLCEIWTRVMGYHRPVSEFNRGKKSEFYHRTYFTEENCLKALQKGVI